MINNKIVVVFCYTRSDKLKKLLDDLLKNSLFGKIKILLIQDGLNYSLAKKETKDEHFKVKQIINIFQKKNPDFIEAKFKSKNYGLANIIENSLDELVKTYESIIVLEDDLCISSNFIFFMSEALDHYKDNKKIFHINGWAPSNLASIAKSKIILTKMMYCWGWATWSNRWIEYRSSKEIKKKNYLKFFDLLKFDYFGIAGHYQQLNMNWKSRKKTWAIFWQLYIWSKGYYCLSIAKSLVCNNGLDLGENHKIIFKNSYFSKVIGGEVFENVDINIKTIKPRESFFFEFRILNQLLLRNILLLINKILIKLKKLKLFF